MAGVVLIGSAYLNAKATDILVHKPVIPTDAYKFTITDVNGNLIFRVMGTSTSFHKQRVLVDSYGRTIVTFRMKWRTMHKRWKAFRGASLKDEDLIFTTKESSLLDRGENVDLHVCWGDSDHVFCIVNRWFEFYEACSRIVMAKGNGDTVRIYPNVDMAFIVSLIVVWDAMAAQKEHGQTVGGVLLKAAPPLRLIFSHGLSS